MGHIWFVIPTVFHISQVLAVASSNKSSVLAVILLSAVNITYFLDFELFKTLSSVFRIFQQILKSLIGFIRNFNNEISENMFESFFSANKNEVRDFHFQS